MSILKPLMSFSIGLMLLTSPVSTQTTVDLSSRQTPLKNQGSRGTCTSFGAIAALEAAYKRAGYGNLDLSEEFCNYVGKMLSLDRNWAKIYPKGPAYRDSGVGAFGGGNGLGNLRALTGGLRVPQETYMKYRSTDYNLGPYQNWKHIWWLVQKNVNDFNLDTKNLPRRAITAPRYYRASGYKVIHARTPSQIEAALRAGYEVVWDFDVKGTTPNGGIWQRVGTSIGAHSMLIVGYDRSSTSSSKHHFICKNSWGSIGAMPSGFTHISYGYVRQNGSTAAYITGVQKPAPWTEISFIGRRNLCFDGHRGTLDIYHVPGTMQWHFDLSGLKVTDRRIGSFRTTTGQMRRVNGQMIGKKLIFWMRSKYPNMGYGDTSESPALCQKFVYGMLDAATGELSGYHQDNAGSVPNPAWGGYARIPSTLNGTDGYLNPVFNNSQPIRPEQFLGSWTCAIDRYKGRLSIQYRDDAALSRVARLTYYGLHCEYVDTVSGIRRPFTAMVRKSRNAEIQMNFTHANLGYVNLIGYMLSWQRGVFAGHVNIGMTGKTNFYAYRTGSQTIPGVATTIGTGCTGSNGRLIHTVVPAPFLGKTSTFACGNGPRGGTGLWMLGLSRSMIFPGTACWLRVNALVYIPASFSASGLFRTNLPVANNRAYLGASIYSQVAGFDAKANAAGLTLSNAVYVRVGGYR